MRITNFQLLFQNENISGGDSSDSCSDGEMDIENPLFVAPDNSTLPGISPPSSPADQKMSAETLSSRNGNNQILPPLVYQSSGSEGVFFSLAPGNNISAHPQFITIPLSMVANGQGDLHKRK